MSDLIDRQAAYQPDHVADISKKVEQTGETAQNVQNEDLISRKWLRHAGLDVRTDRTHAVRSRGAEGYQQENEQEEQEMSEATMIIFVAVFLFGVIMGLALGKANK